MDTNVTTPIRTNRTIAKEKLMEDLRHMVTDAEELLRATASQTGEAAESARIRIQDSLTTARLRLAEAQNSVIARTREAAKATDKFAHEEPWTLIGTATVMGAVIGMLIGRR